MAMRLTLHPGMPTPERRSSGGTSATCPGSSGVTPDARQPDGSRSLSAGYIARRTEIGNSSPRPMPPKRTVSYQQREWQQERFLGQKHYHSHSGAMALLLTNDEEALLSKYVGCSAIHRQCKKSEPWKAEILASDNSLRSWRSKHGSNRSCRQDLLQTPAPPTYLQLCVTGVWTGQTGTPTEILYMGPQVRRNATVPVNGYPASITNTMLLNVVQCALCCIGPSKCSLGWQASLFAAHWNN